VSVSPAVDRGTQPRLHPFTLTFDDPQLERAFRVDDDRATLGVIRVAGVLAVVIFASFGVLDLHIAPGHVPELLVARFGIVCPYTLLVVALTFRPWFGRVQQLAVGSVVVLTGWVVAAMPLIAPEVPTTYASTGSFLILMYVMFVRTRLVPAVPTVVLVVAGYESTLAVSDATALTALYNNFFLAGFLVVGLVGCRTQELLRRTGYLRERELQRERARSDALLHNMLPEPIAQRLRHDPGVIADDVESVTVLFADIVGFTTIAEQVDASTVVSFLDRLFAEFDVLCERHGVEKIKTIGDAYMVVAGLPTPRQDHAHAAAELALDMVDAAALAATGSFSSLQLRIGMSSGPVVAGVIGRRKLAYDLWGHTVNVASRMESHGCPGRVQVSAQTRPLLEPHYVLTEPHAVDVKGIGRLEAAYLVGRSTDEASVLAEADARLSSS
jgi:class 3 adenylate cyclase